MARKAVKKISSNSQTGRFIAGLGALVSIWPASHVARYPHRSDMEALRSDAARIGQDMRRVIEREHGKLKTGQE